MAISPLASAKQNYSSTSDEIWEMQEINSKCCEACFMSVLVCSAQSQFMWSLIKFTQFIEKNSLTARMMLAVPLPKERLLMSSQVYNLRKRIYIITENNYTRSTYKKLYDFKPTYLYNRNNCF
jgi:hypothetical protein